MDFGPLVPANNPAVREMQPTPGLDLGRPAGHACIPISLRKNPPSANLSAFCSSGNGSSSPAWSTIFSVVAIASLKMTPVYEAGGTIEINKPDSSLNFQNSATFSLDYYDPTELETELKILQSDLLALQVIRELNLDRRPEFGGQAPAAPVVARSRSRPAAGRSRPGPRPWSAASREICGSPSVPTPASSRFTTAAPILRWPPTS